MPKRQTKAGPHTGLVGATTDRAKDLRLVVASSLRLGIAYFCVVIVAILHMMMLSRLVVDQQPALANVVVAACHRSLAMSQ
jgi:hypothetical protein